MTLFSHSGETPSPDHNGANTPNGASIPNPNISRTVASRADDDSHEELVLDSSAISDDLAIADDHTTAKLTPKAFLLVVVAITNVALRQLLLTVAALTGLDVQFTESYTEYTNFGTPQMGGPLAALIDPPSLDETDLGFIGTSFSSGELDPKIKLLGSWPAGNNEEDAKIAAAAPKPVEATLEGLSAVFNSYKAEQESILEKRRDCERYREWFSTYQDRVWMHTHRLFGLYKAGMLKPNFDGRNLLTKSLQTGNDPIEQVHALEKGVLKGEVTFESFQIQGVSRIAQAAWLVRRARHQCEIFQAVRVQMSMELSDKNGYLYGKLLGERGNVSFLDNTPFVVNEFERDWGEEHGNMLTAFAALAELRDATQGNDLLIRRASDAMLAVDLAVARATNDNASMLPVSDLPGNLWADVVEEEDGQQTVVLCLPDQPPIRPLIVSSKEHLLPDEYAL